MFSRRNLLLLAGAMGLGVLLAAGVYFGYQAYQAAQPVTINGTMVPPVPPLDPARVAQGAQLYTQYCAECHGANLQGAADWKVHRADGSLPPPPHDSSGHTWHHPDPLLVSLTLDGGDKSQGGTMPPFRDRLTADQAAEIIDFIKSRWGRSEREYQWWMTVTHQDKH